MKYKTLFSGKNMKKKTTTRNVSKGHSCPRLKNLKRKLLTPGKIKHKLQMLSWTWTETDGSNTICPFHHSSNCGGIKIKMSSRGLSARLW